MNKPITIWTIGHLASVWFLKNEEPEKQASITIVPLLESLAQQTVKLMNGLAVPPIDYIYSSTNFIRATKWRSGKGDDHPELFDNVFDAHEVFMDRNNMPRYSVHNLKKDDLVLLETKISHYQLKDQDHKWSSLRPQMDILAISILYDADDEEQEAQAPTIQGLHI
ncbi:hypothetical protein JVU11DRAFT_7664 [Chiua virens]|nr:hypothetical protein JVU11DRAFT_7664 [Chiua virens]